MNALIEQFLSLHDIATVFSQYFSQFFTVPRDTLLLECFFRDVFLLSLPKVSPEKMKAKLMALDPHTTSDYDNASTLFLFKCADQLCFPLANIFNISVYK